MILKSQRWPSQLVNCTLLKMGGCFFIFWYWLDGVNNNQPNIQQDCLPIHPCQLPLWILDHSQVFYHNRSTHYYTHFPPTHLLSVTLNHAHGQFNFTTINPSHCWFLWRWTCHKKTLRLLLILLGLLVSRLATSISSKRTRFSKQNKNKTNKTGNNIETKMWIFSLWCKCCLSCCWRLLSLFLLFFCNSYVCC